MTTRHHRIRSSRAAIALALVLTLAGGAGIAASRGDRAVRPAPAAAQPRTQSAGPLAVQSRTPDNGESEVATDAVLLVQFNASVQPLTTLAAAPTRPVLQIDPPVAGTGRWLTSAMYRFQPADGWSGSTEYTISVVPDLTSLEGRPLAGPQTWSFTTIAPAVADVTPAPDTNQAPTMPVPPPPVGRDQPTGAPPRPQGPNLNQASATGPITVRWNQPVDQGAAELSLSFSPPVAGSFTWPDGRTQVFRPDAPLARSTRYQGTVAAGVPAANGRAVSAEPFTWSFVTAGLAGIASTDPGQGATNAPQGSITLTFNTPMERQSVVDRIRVEPPPDNGPFTFWEPDETRLHINFFPGKPSADYQVTLAPGAVDRFGQTIDREFVLTFRTAPLRPSLTLVGSGRAGVFIAGERSRAVVSSINLERAELALYQIDQAQFAAVMQPREQLKEPPAGAPELRRWQVEFAEAQQNKPYISLVDLVSGEAVGAAPASPLQPGYYLLWAAVNGTTDIRSGLPFVVTRSHLTLKRSADSMTVWALDYHTGAPLADLPLRALNAAGAEVGSGQTDAQGLTTFAVPAPNFTAGPDFLSVVGEREDDVIFTSTSWSSGGGFPYDSTYIGSLTSDRPIYRAGETVFYQGVLRRETDTALALPPSDPGGTLIVQDTRGRELSRTAVRLDEFGSFTGDIKLDAEAPAGFYNMRVDFGPGRGSTAFYSFQVAEFRRPDFFVEVKAARDDYNNGQQIDVTATADLFAGAPVVDGEVRYRVTAETYAFNPKDYPGYSFTDPDLRPRSVPLGARLEGGGRTDARGAFVFAVPADVSGDTTSQIFTIEATVRDADNQEVSGRTNVRVHKASVYAGIKPRGYVGIAEQALTVDLIALDETGKPVANQPLSIQVVERRWRTVQVRDADGSERFESQPEDRDVETRSVTTGADGAGTFTFTPTRGGFYRIVATGQDSAGNEFRSAGGIYVTGTGFTPWQVTNDESLQLVADKREYQPGDVARVLVPAPFENSVGLVTIERQGIISKEIRPFAGNSVLLEVPVQTDYLPNVFVSVALFKAPDGAGTLPQFRTGNVELTVSADSQRLRIAVTPDRTKVQPRESVTFAIKTTDMAGNGVAAELSLALVDEAVLSLTDATPVNAFTQLYGRRFLGVQTSASNVVSLDQVAERASSYADQFGKGGGGGEDLTRTDFRFTADWQPAVRTDANGNADLTVRMPDTLTTWRLTARGITRDSKAGLAETSVQTSKPLIVRPVAPRFFTAGDQPELGAIVNNLSDAALDVRVALAGEGITIEGSAVQTARIEPGGQAKVGWKTSVPNAGVATVRWSATGGPLSDAVELKVPVQALTTPEVVASSGSVTDRVTEVIRGPGTGGAQPSAITLDLWPSLTAALPETVKYLRGWPFENAELTASRILSAVGVAQAQGRAPDAGDLSRWVQRLYTEQHPDGGWGWWSADASDPAISAYVVLALTSARDTGRNVDGGVLGRAADYLRGQLDRPQAAQAPMNPNSRALLTYALSTADGREMGRVFALAQRRETLGPEGEALLALAMERAGVPGDDPRLRPLLTDLISSATVSASAAHWDDAISAPTRLSTATRTTAFALWALVNADPNGPLVDDAVRWLMNERREGRWASTQESALAVLALGAVAEARGENNASYAYRVTLDDRLLKEATVQDAGSAPAETISIRDGLRPGDNPLVIAREPADAPGRLYYQLDYEYVTAARSVGALDHGVAVAREFLAADDDRPLTSVKAGDLVKVRVTVLAPGAMNYVAVEDYLPAGLEAVDASLRTTSAEILERQRAEAERQAKLRGGTCRIGYRLCVNPFTQTNIRDDRVALFARSLPKGAWEYVYFARATTPGTYEIRPTRVSEVYFPDVWGRTDSGVFTVTP
jgi:uncharacterized protein YfaS (alpha-2-macroglobulin family)